MKEIGSGRAGDLEVLRLIEFDKGGFRIHILGTIKGLVSESFTVEQVIEMLGPDLIGVHISPEELEGLAMVIDGEYKRTPMSPLEKVYAIKLSRFGEVQIPPPSLVQALRSSRERGIPIFPLDMNDEEYSDAYTENVGGLTLVRQSLEIKRINRMDYKGSDAAAFCTHWDRTVNRMSDFRTLEKLREERMAMRVHELSSKARVSLFILELERLEGIRRILLSL
ncbi:MAG: hypothetical protein QCI82_06040 [Candidatus Thermoplasmatota archaeon]|nr:hypothetical protein [Candidatus Thermoplasmatota archaeon]